MVALKNEQGGDRPLNAIASRGHAVQQQTFLSHSLLTSGRPVSAATAARIAETVYGLVGDITVLAGEKDANFRLRVGGRDYLLKIISPGDDPAFIDMHSRALLHVAKTAPEMPVQRLVLTRKGEANHCESFGDEGDRSVRMVTFVEGSLQRGTPETATQRQRAGAMLARLQAALEGFRHPAENTALTWDMKHAANLIPLARDREDGARLTAALAVFEREVLTHLAELPQQMVHNDLNSDNIIVDSTDTDRVVGLIDFGDMVRTARVFDLVIGAAYQATEAQDPLQAALDFAAGFLTERPLTAREWDAFIPALRARMAMRIIITEARAELFPENRSYILRNTPNARLQFDRLSRLDPDETQRCIAEILKSPEATS